MSYILIYVFLFLSLTPLCYSKTNIHLVHRRKHNISEILKLDRLRVESIHLSLQRRAISISESSPSLPLSSGISLGAAEYLVQVGLGTPPASLYLVMDTGSDITWLQCSPCAQCYIQSDPLFSPQNSSTYELLSCSSPVCEELTTSSCEERVSSCLYHVQYLDKSSSSGVLSKEVFTLAGGRRVPTKILFGCGNVNMGLFTGYSGILGMGGGPYSFPLQLPDMGSSFSYCMVDRESPQQVSSPLVLADEEQGTVFSYTPLLTNPRSSTHYFVNLEGISVNSELLDVPRSLFEMDENGLGGVVIDSGTTLTHLPAPAYNELKRVFVKALGQTNIVKENRILDTCFDAGDDKIPVVVLHFQGDVKMELTSSNVAVRVGRLRCLGFVGTQLDFSILGNVQQQSFRVRIDLKNRRIGFSTPYAC